MRPIDATLLGSGERLQTEVAVVGAGPAGIVLALELAGTGHRVLLIESGGESFDASVQRLANTVGGDPTHLPMALNSRRQVGGASNVWAGRCVPFDPIDFAPRQIAADARWPVAYDELRGYFRRACEWLVCGAPAFDADEIPTLAHSSLIPGWPGGEIRATALERWSQPTKFGRRYRARLRSSPLLTLVTGLTCTEIVCRPGGGVDHLVGRTLAGARLTVHAACYVLATGGLEATRLLFASSRVHPGGIGNHSGHLGRWYMGHVETRIANVRFTTAPGATIYDFERDPEGVYVRRRFTFSEEFMLAHDLPNGAMWLVNPELGDCAHRSGILSFLYLVLASPLGHRLLPEAIRMGQLKTTRPTSRSSHLLNVIRELGPTARFALISGYQRYLKRGRKVPGVFVPSASNVYPLLYHGEHLPHRASHVTLTSQRDALGMPRLRTELRFEDVDIHGAIRAHEHLDRYLRRHRLGRLEPLYDDLQKAVRGQVFGGAHQAGITRMSARPEDGVLDRNLAVHGFDDLFVASSSAFVTSSQANSAFMIVVFALRLADHLRRTLR
jgi:choline dehydrogenase-like flavoprotein